MFNLVEAVCGMETDWPNDEIRSLPKTGQYPRSAADQSILMLFFAEQIQRTNLESDILMANKLVKQLSYVNLEELRAEHISHILNAFKLLYPHLTNKKMATDHVATIVKHSVKELYRYNVQDLIDLVDCTYFYYDVAGLDKDVLKSMYQAANTFLVLWFDYQKASNVFLSAGHLTKILQFVIRAQT